MPTDIYYIFFPNDRIGMKALGMMFSTISIDFGRRPLTSRLPLSVYWVFILDIFLTVVAAGMGWHILAAGWGRQHNLIEPGWTFSAIAAGDGISTSSFACLSLMASPYLFNPPLVAMTVQFFYAWRIWVIKGWRVIPATIVLVRNLLRLLVRRLEFADRGEPPLIRSRLRKVHVLFRSRQESRLCTTSRSLQRFSTLGPPSGSQVVRLLISYVHFPLWQILTTDRSYHHATAAHRRLHGSCGT